jgi:predicted nucleic acid-binding protein
MTVSAEDERSLVDTNIVIYAHDRSDPAKHLIALELLERLSDQGRLVRSAEVLNEFCSVMMRPNRAGRLEPDQLLVLLRELEAIGEVVSVTAAMTFRALGALRTYGLSFWDGLIWAAAAENGIPVIYTEDFQAGREVEGVRFINPFLVAGPPGA